MIEALLLKDAALAAIIYTALFVGVSGFLLGFLACRAITSHREKNARADGYYEGVREGRHWARLQKLSSRNDWQGE